jgi:glycine cleavage system H protein
MPVSGEVVEVNQALEASPETVNSSPLENGWFVKIKVCHLHLCPSLYSLD